jgi:transcriptional regulator with XRE-family HTH domain
MIAMFHDANDQMLSACSDKSDTAPPVPNGKQLGLFLRTRRQSLTPERQGLSRHGRIRTPGLRREEVAQLAGIGVDWYTKLEQGRSAGVSATTLQAIASALQCTPAETRHLFILAGLRPQGDTLEEQACEQVSDIVQQLLDQLAPLPAVVQNAQFDILGFNHAYCQLMGVDIGALPHAQANCIYLALTNPHWRAALPDYEDLLARMVAMFRAALTGHAHDPVWQQKLQLYQDVSPEFRRLWEQYQVQDVENHVKRFKHPQHGVLRLQQVNWWSAARNGNRLLVYVPVDEASKAALRSGES